MTRYHSILLFMIAMAVIVTVSTVRTDADSEPQQPSTKPETTWEYKLISANQVGLKAQSNLEAQSNELGKEGWELAGTLSLNGERPVPAREDGRHTYAPAYLIFKKAVRP